MPDGLREYNSSSFAALNRTMFVAIKDFPAWSQSCHLDPQSFYGVYKWYLPALARRFRLTIGEMILVQTTFDCMAKSHYYFGVTAEYLLYGEENQIREQLESYYRGFKFGYFILQMMLCVNKITPNPPSRFNDYKLFVCPDYKSWDEACIKKTKVILTLWKFFDKSPKGRLMVQQKYKLSHELLMKCVNGAGALTVNHSIGILSSVGLLPSWYLKAAVIKADSTYMKHFRKVHYMGNLDNTGMDRVANHLIRSINKSLNCCISMRILENVLCKMYRTVCPTANDDHWKDLLMLYQPVIFCNADDDSWTILHSDGNMEMGKGPLIRCVPWGQEAVNMQHLHECITFPCANLPTKSVMSAVEKMRLNHEVIWNQYATRTIVSIPKDYSRPNFTTNRGKFLFNEALKEMHDVPIPRIRRSF